MTLTELWDNHLKARDKWDVSRRNEAAVNTLVTYGVYKALGGKKEFDMSSHVFSTDRAKESAKVKYPLYIEGIVDFIRAIEIYTGNKMWTDKIEEEEHELREKYDFDPMIKNHMEVAVLAHMHNKVTSRVVKLTRDRGAGDIIYNSYEYYLVAKMK